MKNRFLLADSTIAAAPGAAIYNFSEIDITKSKDTELLLSFPVALDAPVVVVCNDQTCAKAGFSGMSGTINATCPNAWTTKDSRAWRCT